MSLRSLLTAGALVTIGLLAGRILGLVREMMLAGYFGTGAEADLAISLLIVPDFITGALVGSAVGATLVPLYAARTPEKASALFWQAFLVSVGFFTVLAAIVGFSITGAASLQSEGAALAASSPFAFLIAVSAIPLTAATSIITSYLQYRGRFAVPAFANAIFNFGIIMALWLLPSGLIMLALGIMLAALARLLFHAAAFFRAGGTWSRGSFTPWQIDRPFLKTYITTVTTDICNLFPQFAPYMVIAAFGGGLAVFNYAFKLAYVPATLGYSLTQMVLLPWFVKLLHSEGKDNKGTHYVVTLQVAWCFSLAVCLSLSLAARDIAQLCFGYGKMTDDDIGLVAQLFDVGVWAMPGMFLSSIWQQIMYAHGKPNMPLVASMVQAIAIVPLCWLGYQAIGLFGVSLAYAALQFLPVLWLSYAGYKQGIIPRWWPSPVYAQMAVAAILAWLPLAWLFNSLELPAIAGILLAMLIGLITLAAGLAVCHPVRQWGLQKLGRI